MDTTYEIIFQLPEDGGVRSSDFIAGMDLFIKGLEGFNKSILGAIQSDIEVITYIEEISAGSVRFNLQDRLKKISDDDIDSFIDNPSKAILKKCLKRARDFVIKKLDEGKDLPQLEREQGISMGVAQIINSSDISKIIDIQPDNYKLLKSVSDMSQGAMKTGGNVLYERIAVEKNFNAIGEDDELVEPQTVKARIFIKKPDILDDNTKYWIFEYNNKNIKIDISNTTIARDMTKFIKGDNYIVMLEITEIKNVSGKYKTAYKIKEILEFIRGPEQAPLL